MTFICHPELVSGSCKLTHRSTIARFAFCSCGYLAPVRSIILRRHRSARALLTASPYRTSRLVRFTCSVPSSPQAPIAPVLFSPINKHIPVLSLCAKPRSRLCNGILAPAATAAARACLTVINIGSANRWRGKCIAQTVNNCI